MLQHEFWNRILETQVCLSVRGFAGLLDRGNADAVSCVMAPVCVLQDACASVGVDDEESIVVVDGGVVAVVAMGS